MYCFRTLPDDDPLLDSSPLMRALDFLKHQLDQNPEGIPLTKSAAFRRAMVADAITTIRWPDWTEQEIYHSFCKIKVADEHHFEPLWRLHWILRDMRVVRPYRGQLRLTKAGVTLFSSRFQVFDAVVREIIFEAKHFKYSRENRALMGNWDIWLNVIDIEAQHGISGEDLTKALYGPLEIGQAFDPRTSALYDGVLTPLVWTGLLQEDMSQGRKLSERVYIITPLWRRYLELDPKKPRLRVVH
ncbi:hypothetical protein [Roseinatronobacter monicus]|uniref:hypothetical protein n=1 Tax=Roseinatronobacter monicus TaxID=393481 RepID=UPI003F30E4A8